MKQTSFQKRNWKHALCHGGSLRNVRAGRGYRPLSTREPLHLVFKANRGALRTSFRGYRSYFLIQALIEKYARRFWIRIEQVSIQGDHIHLLIRAGKRSNYQAFFRVIAGQIAQRFQKLGLVTDTPKGSPVAIAKKVDIDNKVGGDNKIDSEIKSGSARKVSFWKHRPFTRVVRGGRRALQTVRNYIRLNEKEALGEIEYKKQRLKGLNKEEWEVLWS